MIRAAIEHQLDEAINRAGSERCFDLMSDFALPMPTNIILEMFGFPLTAAYRFYETADVIIPPIARGTPEEWFMHADAVYSRHWDFILEAAKQRQENPGTDLLSRIVVASDDGESLNDLRIDIDRYLFGGSWL